MKQEAQCRKCNSQFESFLEPNKGLSLSLHNNLSEWASAYSTCSRYLLYIPASKVREASPAATVCYAEVLLGSRDNESSGSRWEESRLRQDPFWIVTNHRKTTYIVDSGFSIQKEQLHCYDVLKLGYVLYVKPEGEA